MGVCARARQLTATCSASFPPSSAQRDARPLFELLLTKYDSALERAGAEAGAAGSLMPYVEAIGARYFGIKPPQDGLQAMMASMFGGGGGMPARPALRR